MATMYCRKCKKNTNWARGKAILNAEVMAADFFSEPDPDEIRVGTVTRCGKPGVVTVVKCSQCGRSIYTGHHDNG